MNELETLMIYKQYLEMMYYTENIVVKFPKSEKLSLVTTIKNTTYEGMKCIINAHKEFSRTKRLSYLNELDVNLKMLKVLVRISYKRRFINAKNYGAWSKKLTNVGNLMGGWIKSCAEQ